MQIKMNKVERQMKLETDAVVDGIARYYDQVKREPTHYGPGVDLLARAIEPMADAIRVEQENIRDRAGPGRPRNYAFILLSLEPEKLAVITIQGLFDLIATRGVTGSPVTVTEACVQIGRRCALERYFDKLLRREQKLFRLLVNRNKNKWVATKRALERSGLVDTVDWHDGNRHIYLGAELIKIAITSTALFERGQVTEIRRASNRNQKSARAEGDVTRPKTTATVEFTTELEEWLQQAYKYQEALANPIFRPMITPPIAWPGLIGGGYLTIPDIELVKCRNNKQRVVIEAAMETGKLQPVLTAVNAMQETPWRINRRIHDVMREAWEKQYELPGIAHHRPRALPTVQLSDGSTQQTKRARRERARIHKLNAKGVSDRALFVMRMRLCEDLLDEESIYFPYQLDYRGRVYPIPQVFNPQSNDTGRALLQFAVGKPLGKNGAYWLKVHLANTYGYDKLTFDERVNWVSTHQTKIVESATDPLKNHDFWTKADKPWSFLAACIEWAAYLIDGEKFKSHVPVALDGTCNGLQHLTAMSRDLIGGRATNLLSNDRPQDLYQEVANRVIARVEKDSNAGNRYATEWLGEITRKVVKKATMTTPYGVTPAGIRKQLIDDEFTSHMEDEWTGANYLTPIVLECINSVVVNAKELMEWLKSVVVILAKADLGVFWTSPIGFPVLMEHRRHKSKRIPTSFGSFLVYDRDQPLKLQITKQVNSITPNLVHSLDASHLMRTVNRLYSEGLRDFAMVHDSYGVHACDVDNLRSVLAKEFYAIHKHSISDQFIAELREANPEIKLPDPLPKGELDLEDVLQANYLFS